jgi:hypothetical protein
LTDDIGVWSNIFLEQFKCLEDAGLLGELDKLKVTCVTQKDGRAQAFYSLCQTEGLRTLPIEIEFVLNSFPNDQEMIKNLESNAIISENVTFRKLYSDCLQEDFQLLYFHSKGITAVHRALLRGNLQLYKQYYYGRQFSNWGVLTNWRTCVEALKTYDVAGVNYQKEYPCYGGNFFWANSSYIRRLPDPSTIDWWYKRKQESTNDWLRNSAPERFKEEQWTCSDKNVKAYNLVELSDDENPYDCYLPYSKYAYKAKTPV